MSEFTVKTVAKDKAGNEQTVEVPFYIGDTVAENVELFGEEIVLANFKARVKLAIQAAMRRVISTSNGEGEDAVALSAALIKATMKEFKLTDGSRARMTPQEKALKQAADMTPEQRAQLQQMLRDMDAA